MPPPAPAILYTTPADIEGVLSAEGMLGRVDDDGDGNEDTVLDASGAPIPLSLVAARMGTADVNRYLQVVYDADQIARSGSAWDWATTCGACWLCRRRGNPIPESLAAAREDALAEMEAVRSGVTKLEDAAERVADAPAWSNTTYDPNYRTRPVRVDRTNSERTPRDRPPAPDYPAEYSQER